MWEILEAVTDQGSVCQTETLQTQPHVRGCRVGGVRRLGPVTACPRSRPGAGPLGFLLCGVTCLATVLV